MLKKDLENYRDIYNETIETIENAMHVYNLITGGLNLKEVAPIKEKFLELSKKVKFSLHKGKSNFSNIRK